MILGPSRRHGVGVFVTRVIAPGTRLPLFSEDDWRFVRSPKGAELAWCQRFGVADEGGFHCAKDWHRMSIGWYLNHSARPNVAIEGLTARASRALRAGEELTVDYALL